MRSKEGIFNDEIEKNTVGIKLGWDRIPPLSIHRVAVAVGKSIIPGLIGYLYQGN